MMISRTTTMAMTPDSFTQRGVPGADWPVGLMFVCRTVVYPPMILTRSLYKLRPFIGEDQ